VIAIVVDTSTEIVKTGTVIRALKKDLLICLFTAVKTATDVSVVDQRRASQTNHSYKVKANPQGS
jgi:hypothetical protein